MPNTTITDLHRLARIGFVTGHPPRLLEEDRVFHQAVLATWVEPECISRWMDDLEDRVGVLLSEWAAERARETTSNVRTEQKYPLVVREFAQRIANRDGFDWARMTDAARSDYLGIAQRKCGAKSVSA